jgi:hypothetical protein
MSGIPVWFWGALGGLLLGIVGFLILYPACDKGATQLLKRFVISVLVKLVLAAGGFWLGIKLFNLDPTPLVMGFLGGYVISMFVEILPCIWKLRRCMKESTGNE